MAITYIPRGKDPIEKFTEGFSPYLQMAMQAQLQKRLEEQQRQKAMEQLAQMGYAQETPQMVGAPQFLGGGQMPVKPAGNIPKQYQFKPGALKDLGMSFELPGTGITLKSKEQGLTYAPEGFEITGYDKSGNAIVRSDVATKQKKLLNASRLRQEFINRPEVKEYIMTSTQVKGMNELIKSAVGKDPRNLVAVDQGLITMYNKMTDPNSVVRESEYARTPQNLPIFHRVEGLIQRIQQGGAGLTDDDRKAMVEAAKLLQKARGSTYNETLQGYSELASEYDLDPKLIMRGLEEYEDVLQQSQQENIGQTSSGRKFVIER